MATPPQRPAVTLAAAPTRERLLGNGLTWLSTWTLRLLILCAGLWVIGHVVEYTWSVLLPVFLALVLTTVLQPLARLLRGRAGFPAPLAAALALLLAVGTILLTFFLLAPSVGDQATEIADSASQGLTTLEQWLIDKQLVTEEQIQTVVTALQTRLQSSAATITTGVLVGVSAVGSFLVNLIVVLVLSFYFLKDGERFLPWVGGIAGRDVGRHVMEVGSRAWDTLGGFIRTQALVGVIDAVLIGAALLVVGVPLAIPLAVLTFFAAFIPIIGAVAVGALAILVALVSNGFVGALIILAAVVVVQQLEGNVLLPYLQGKSLDLHAAVVLLSVVLGSTLFGVVGAFLAVPAAAIAAVVLRYLNEVLMLRSEPVGQAPAAVVRSPGTVSDPVVADQLVAERDNPGPGPDPDPDPGPRS